MRLLQSVYLSTSDSGLCFLAPVGGGLALFLISRGDSGSLGMWLDRPMSVESSESFRLVVSMVMLRQYLQAFPSSSIPTNTFRAVRLWKERGRKGGRSGEMKEVEVNPHASCGIPEVESDQ